LFFTQYFVFLTIHQPYINPTSHRHTHFYQKIQHCMNDAILVASLSGVRTWTGGYLVDCFTRDQKTCTKSFYSGSQADLGQRLTLEPLSEQITLIQRSHQGGTPYPLALLNPFERTLHTMPPDELPNIATVSLSGDYRALIAKELETITTAAAKHPDIAFAQHYLDILATSRKYHPHKKFPQLAKIVDRDVPHELEIRMLRLRNGFKFIAEDSDDPVFVSVELDDGTTTYDYAQTQIGQDWKAWEELALETYYLANRLAPTPTTWHRVLEPWLNEYSETTQPPLLPLPAQKAGSDWRR
jgi:hypothetical protein